MYHYINKRDIRAIQKGNFRVLEKIYTAFYDAIFRFIFLKSRSRETAEDLASETFLNFFEYVLKGNEVGHVRGFLYQSARHTLARYYRTPQYELAGKEGLDDPPQGTKDPREDIEERLDEKISWEILERSLAALKEEWQEVIWLRFVEGYSYSEIASLRETSEGAVRVMVSRAVKELKQIIENRSMGISS